MEGRNKERNKGTCERALKTRRIYMKRDGKGSRRAIIYTCSYVCKLVKRGEGGGV